MKFNNVFLGSIMTVLICSCGSDIDEDDSNNNTSNIVLQTCEDLTWNESLSFGNVEDIDGNVYRTVSIEGKEWMAENLNVSRFNNGLELELLSGFEKYEQLDLSADSLWMNFPARVNYVPSQEDSLLDDYYGIAPLYDCYGSLYNSEVIKSDLNVCPIGWRIPTKEDFELLRNLSDSEQSWKSLSGYRVESLDTEIVSIGKDGDDTFGWRGLPGGYIDQGEFFAAGTSTVWWSNSIIYDFPDGTGTPQYYLLYLNTSRFDNSSAYDVNENSGAGAYIRCIKD